MLFVPRTMHANSASAPWTATRKICLSESFGSAEPLRSFHVKRLLTMPYPRIQANKPYQLKQIALIWTCNSEPSSTLHSESFNLRAWTFYTPDRRLANMHNPQLSKKIMHNYAIRSTTSNFADLGNRRYERFPYFRHAVSGRQYAVNENRHQGLRFEPFTAISSEFLKLFTSYDCACTHSIQMEL